MFIFSLILSFANFANWPSLPQKKNDLHGNFLKIQKSQKICHMKDKHFRVVLYLPYRVHIKAWLLSVVITTMLLYVDKSKKLICFQNPCYSSFSENLQKAHPTVLSNWFYSFAFSLEERSRQSDGEGLRSVWLELDPGVLMVERVSGMAQIWDKQMRQGMFLLAFEVSEPERQVIEKRVVDQGGRIESRTEFSTYFRDPENNRIAISSHSLQI